MQEYCQPKYYNFGVQLYLLDVIWYSQILYKFVSLSLILLLHTSFGRGDRIVWVEGCVVI